MTVLNYSAESVHILTNELRCGRNICVPTDTIYGIAASANSVSAIQNIFTLKNRSLTKPLALLVNSMDMAKKYFKSNLIIEDLMKKFWPGPLTIISEKAELARRNTAISTATFNNSTIGIRFPQNSVITEIINLLNAPIFATSINESGNPALNDPIDIENFLTHKHQSEIYILNQENYRHSNMASTILKVNTNNIEILRNGDLNIDINQYSK